MFSPVFHGRLRGGGPACNLVRRFTCAPALEVNGTPRQRTPPGACDAHFHIFGPYDRFPLDTARPYTPPPATIPHDLSMAQKLRLTRAVVVQASVYGTDNAVTLDTGRA